MFLEALHHLYLTVKRNSQQIIGLFAVILLLPMPLLEASASCPPPQTKESEVGCYDMLTLPNPRLIGLLVDDHKNPVTIQVYSYIIDEKTCAIAWIPEGDTSKNAWQHLSLKCQTAYAHGKHYQAYVPLLTSSSAQVFKKLLAHRSKKRPH